MTLPSFVRTWQIRSSVRVQADTNANQLSKLVMYNVVQAMSGSGTWKNTAGNTISQTNPWIVQSSCNGTGGASSFGNGDAVDRWASTGSIVGAASGTNHSWTVLRQSGIASNFEVCIDMNSGNHYLATIAMSPSVGFGIGSGLSGTAGGRPTASDETVICSTTNWGVANNSNTDQVLHFQKAADGSAFRMFMCRAGFCQGIWSFEIPASTPAAWTDPSVTVFKVDGTALPTAVTPTYTHLANGLVTFSRVSSTNFTSYWTGEGVAATNSFIPDDLAVPNDISGEWPFYPIGVYSTTVNARGRNGSLVDVWWAPVVAMTGTGFPNDDTRQYISMGNVIVPWDRSLPLVA